MIKALIVDDELHTKEAIELMIDWDKYQVEEILYARNGKEAQSIILSSHPDILFCDMEMPVMGGKALLDWLVDEEIHMQVIAISGYNDFEYVHATLLAGGIDYILKPFSQEVLINAVEKAILRIQGEKETKYRLQQHERLGIEMAAQIMQDFCQGKTTENEKVEQALKRLGAGEGEFLMVSILNRNPDEIIEERYGGDTDLFFFTTGNILKDIFSNMSFCQDIFTDPFLWMAFIQGGGEPVDPISVSGKLKIFEKKVMEYLGLSVTYVVSSQSISMEKLEEAVFEQKKLLAQRNVWGNNNLKPYSDTVETVPSILSMELILDRIMQKRDSHALREMLDNYCGKLRETDGLKIGTLQKCTADMNLLLRRIGDNNHIPSRAAKNYLSLWINDIDVWENQVLSRLELIQKYYVTESSPAEKIYSYICEHYKEDITLSSIARDFYQSPQYIARIFRSGYGITVTMAITNVRIQHACRLLENGMSTAQAAEMVGYEDENYFRRVFKKQTGMTPKQFRNSRES